MTFIAMAVDKDRNIVYLSDRYSASNPDEVKVREIRPGILMGISGDVIGSEFEYFGRALDGETLSSTESPYIDTIINNLETGIRYLDHFPPLPLRRILDEMNLDHLVGEQNYLVGFFREGQPRIYLIDRGHAYATDGIGFVGTGSEQIQHDFQPMYRAGLGHAELLSLLKLAYNRSAEAGSSRGIMIKGRLEGALQAPDALPATEGMHLYTGGALENFFYCAYPAGNSICYDARKEYTPLAGTGELTEDFDTAVSRVVSSMGRKRHYLRPLIMEVVLDRSVYPNAPEDLGNLPVSAIYIPAMKIDWQTAYESRLRDHTRWFQRLFPVDILENIRAY